MATPFLTDNLFSIIGFIILLSETAVDYTFLKIGGLADY